MLRNTGFLSPLSTVGDNTNGEGIFSPMLRNPGFLSPFSIVGDNTNGGESQRDLSC
jgi:hypothetical protein